jgi:hypothetical protein
MQVPRQPAYTIAQAMMAKVGLDKASDVAKVLFQAL